MLLKYPSGGGRGLNLMHENQPSNVLQTHYANTLVKSANPCSNMFLTFKEQINRLI